MERKRIEIDYEVYEKLKFALGFNIEKNIDLFLKSLGIEDLYNELSNDIYDYLEKKDISEALEINDILEDRDYEKCCNIINDINMYGTVEKDKLIDFLKNESFFKESKNRSIFSITMVNNGKFNVPIRIVDKKDGKYNIGNTKEYILKNVDSFKLKYDK